MGTMDTAALRSPRHALTALTAGLMVLVTLPFARSASQLVQAAFAPGLDQELQLSMIAYELDPTEFGLFLKLGAVVMAVACVWTVALAAGVFLRAEGARMAALITFAFFGLISVLMALGALAADPRPDGWTLAMITGPVNVAVLALLVSRTVADDVSRGSFYRQRARQASLPRDMDTASR